MNKNKLWIVGALVACVLVGGSTLFYRYFWKSNFFTEKISDTKVVVTKTVNEKQELSSNDVFGELDTRFFHKYLRIDKNKRISISKLLVLEVVKQIIKNLKISGEKIEFAYKLDETQINLGVRWVNNGTIVYKYYTFKVKSNAKS